MPNSQPFSDSSSKPNAEPPGAPHAAPDGAAPSDITRLLGEMNASGNDALAARAELLGILYRELRGYAVQYFRSVRPGHTLQPTALVHEAMIRVFGAASIEWQNRSHFLAVAANSMRHVLADHARRHRTEKRGGDGERQRVTLAGIGSDDGERQIDALDLEEALVALQEMNPRLAQVVELRFYGGLSVDEAAHVLAVSPRTVELDWRMARAWLRTRLDERGHA